MKQASKELEQFEDRSVEPGVWRYAHARRARVVVDGADYFDFVQQAMLKARQRIMLIGWDFDTRIHLHRGRRWFERPFRREHPSRLGSFILWLNRHQPELEIRILKWSYGFLKFFGRGSMLLDLARWFPHKRIDFKFDTAHPIACCHHQKIVVIDGEFAVCGGIDMTSRRWDTRDHAEHDERRKEPNGSEYGPWHDITMMMEGDVAGALDELGRARWLRAGGKPLEPTKKADESAWPEALEADFENVEIGIARTRAKYGEVEGIDEVEKLHLQHIAEAKHFIYAENQYFASRKVAEALAQRLSEPDPPEVVIVHSLNADGWLEEQAMDPARDALVKALRALDKQNKFHIYTPFSGQTPIYVHAKITIVDDRILRIGSANFNNRSMGLDSECDVFIDAAREANAGANVRSTITRLRHSLLAEHLGLEESAIAGLIDKHGSMAAMIAAIGEQNSRFLRPLEPDDDETILDELAARQVLDPEEPDEIFDLRIPENGLFRKGSLLARARAKLKRKAIAAQ